MKKLVALICCITLVCTFIPAVSAEETQLSNLPTMYITLENGVRQEEITKGTYLPASCSLVGAGEKYDFSGTPLSIKGRGNSTWSLPKKPYAIKFGSKIDLMGMGKAKSWCLLANYYDKTLMRNNLTHELAADLGIPYTIECKTVDLVINGIYRGNYTLCEKVEIGSKRVDIGETDGSALFEIETASRHEEGAGSHDYCHETPLGVHFTYKEPEWDAFFEDDDDENDPAAIARAKQKMQEVMNSNNIYLDETEASLSKGKEAYSEYIDIDSFINWYIVNEFVKNFDSGFITSVYCYRNADGKIFMGPCWDYDTCLGNQKVLDGLNYEGFRVNFATWFNILLEDKDFYNALRARWTELRTTGVINKWLEKFPEMKEEITESQKMDQKVWPDAMRLTELRGDPSVTYFTFEEEYNYLYNWTLNRIDWLDKMWNTDYLKGFDPLSSNNNSNDLFKVVDSTASIGGHQPEDALDGTYRTKFCAASTEKFYVTFKAETPQKITRYALCTANDTNGLANGRYDLPLYQCRNPKSWTLQASNDGVNFNNLSVDTLDSRNGIDLGKNSYNTFEYRVKNPGEYLYYRLVINDIWNRAEAGNIMQFADLLVKCDTTLRGDCDLDNEITSFDALLALQHSVEKIELNPGGFYAGDLDISGSIDATCALKILQCSINMIDLN